MILNLADLLQTIPSLAMLGLIMIVIGAGKQTVITGLALYSCCPLSATQFWASPKSAPRSRKRLWAAA